MGDIDKVTHTIRVHDEHGNVKTEEMQLDPRHLYLVGHVDALAKIYAQHAHDPCHPRRQSEAARPIGERT